jgi:hypothetical protein
LNGAAGKRNFTTAGSTVGGAELERHSGHG